MTLLFGNFQHEYEFWATQRERVIDEEKKKVKIGFSKLYKNKTKGIHPS